jgi:putative salt-induced outer membrane protein
MIFFRKTLALTVGLSLASLTFSAHSQALAQATVKADGQFRAALGLGASLSSGNTQSSNLSLSGDGMRLTDRDKTSLFGNALYARSDGVTTSEQMRLGGRYDYNLGEALFVFGRADFDRNKFANLTLRTQLGTGLGWHVLKTPSATWDVFGGPGYVSDRYVAATVIDGASRSSYHYATLLLGEESTHKLSATTSIKQRLTLAPNLKHRGEFLANWDAGLAVAMTRALNLNVGFSVVHNSEPGAGRKTTDTLLTTGVSVKFD